MSVLLNRGPPSQPESSTAASASLQIVIDQERGEKKRKVEDRVAESLLRERIAVGAVNAHGVGEEHTAEEERRREVEPPAHANDERKQAYGKKDQRVEKHLKPGVGLAVRDRQHRHAGLGVVLGAVEGERPEVRRRPREDDEEEEHRV